MGVPKPGSNDVVMGLKDVQANVAIQKARPKKAEILARFPDARYKEWKDARGVTQYKIRVTPRTQKDRQDLLDMEMPSIRLEKDRAEHLAATTPKVEVLNSWGQRVRLDARFADGIARQRGMHHVMRVKGQVIERGPDGMLFRLVGQSWQPTGRWCLSTPWAFGAMPKTGEEDGTMRLEGMQRDPDGGAWLPIEGEWMEVLDVGDAV